MRLSFIVQWVGILGCFAGCSTLDFAGSGYYKSGIYDVQGQAPAGYALPEESGLNKGVDDQSKADYHFTLAETYSMQGLWDKAVENYRLTLLYDPQSHVAQYRLASEYVRGGLVSQAMEHCRKAIELKDDYADAHLLLASLQSVMGFHQQARARYKMLLQKDPQNHEAAVLIGASYVDEGKIDRGIRYFETLARSSKEKANVVWYYLGRTYLQKGGSNNIRNAESAFKTSVRLQPDFVQAVLELGRVYEKRGKSEKAIKLLESYQETYGPVASVAEPLSQLYLVKEMYEKALVQLQVIAENDPQNLNVQLKRAFILVDQKKHNEAIPILEGILHQTPESDRVRFYLGAVYEEIQDYKAAIQQFREIRPESKYFAEALMHRSYLHKLQGETDEAITVLSQNLTFVEENPKVYALYGSILESAGDLNKSRELLVVATGKFPEDTQLLYQLGAVYDQMGLKQQAVETMEKLISMDEDHVEGLNHLAFVYAEKTENLEAAEKLARRAQKLKPGDGYILDTLGWVLYKKNQVTEAIRLLEKAHRIEGKESIIAEHLGDAYFKIHLPSKAKEMYKKAIRVEKSADKQARIKAKIDTIEQRLQTEKQLRSQRIPASN